jgi:MoxR-like ATPase
MPESDNNFEAQISDFRESYGRIVEQVRKVIVGHQEVIDQVMSCLLCGGHALLEGVPGLGKTLLVRTLADVLDVSFSRIQFTPDLMPADITGTNIVVTDPQGGKAFRFQQGPIFAHLVLADEVNRATPKTQSAVLEAMQEQTVSVSRQTYPLPSPFFVMATENPLEMEGTYPLPEAQLDRFMFKINVATPSLDELVAILDRTTGTATPSVAKAADGAKIQQMRAVVRQVPVASHVKSYAASLVLASHPDNALAPQAVKQYVRYGSSPRGAQAIIMAAKVSALRAGRANVSFGDVQGAAKPALRHRLILSFEGQATGASAEDIIAQILTSVPQPE